MVFVATILFVISTSWMPAVFAVTASLWGAIRYYSASGCQPGNLIYIESFPLNVCYKTGNLAYYKMNTVTKNGVSGCSSCWHYVRQQYLDASCVYPSTNPNSMIYRDTSASCGLITGATSIYARYCHPFIPLPHTKPPSLTTLPLPIPITTITLSQLCQYHHVCYQLCKHGNDFLRQRRRDQVDDI